MQHTSIVGAECCEEQSRGFLNGGRKPALPNGEGSAWGVYIQDEIVVGTDGRLALIPGLRHDAYGLSGDAFSARNEHTETSAKFAAH